MAACQKIGSSCLPTGLSHLLMIMRLRQHGGEGRPALCRTPARSRGDRRTGEPVRSGRVPIQPGPPSCRWRGEYAQSRAATGTRMASRPPRRSGKRSGRHGLWRWSLSGAESAVSRSAAFRLSIWRCGLVSRSTNLDRDVTARRDCASAAVAYRGVLPEERQEASQLRIRRRSPIRSATDLIDSAGHSDNCPPSTFAWMSLHLQPRSDHPVVDRLKACSLKPKDGSRSLGPHAPRHRRRSSRKVAPLSTNDVVVISQRRGWGG